MNENIKNLNDNWIEKCCICVHSYERKDDDYLFCRVRSGICKFKPKNTFFTKTGKDEHFFEK